MEDDNDYPMVGKNIQKWSELDPFLPILDLNIELARRRNVTVASLVILSALLKAERQQREKYLAILSPRHFDPMSLPRYLFEKLTLYLRENETIPVEEMEKWIPEFFTLVWGEPPEGRMVFGNHYTLRQILNFEPTEAQVHRAIELRKMVMEQELNPK
jgi:hypothetical protein